MRKRALTIWLASALAVTFVASLATLNGTMAASLEAAVAAAPSERPSTYWEISDPPRDSRFGINTDYTSLSTRTRGHYVVKLHGTRYTTKRLNAAEVYFDAKLANPGPEYKFVVEFTADRDGESGQWLLRMKNWRTSLTELACPRWRTRVDYAKDVVAFKIPKACLGAPSRVRWNAVTWNITKYRADGGWYGYYDAVPDWQTFGRDWVA